MKSWKKKHCMLALHLGVSNDIEDRASPPRPKKFYDENGALRNYFYVMDNRGRLFLEETKRRNMATSMKDIKFLDFIVRNMKPNKTGEFVDMDSLSLCGKERNFIAHADRLSPFTFKDKIADENGIEYLRYGGSLKQLYRTDLLAFHPHTGRIYHRIIGHKYYTGSYGLLHPHLCLELGEKIRYDNEEEQYIYEENENHSCPIRLFDKDLC